MYQNILFLLRNEAQRKPPHSTSTPITVLDSELPHPLHYHWIPITINTLQEHQTNLTFGNYQKETQSSREQAKERNKKKGGYDEFYNCTGIGHMAKDCKTPKAIPGRGKKTSLNT